jgi:hypothetical protein
VYALQIEQAERLALLGALGVDKNPRDALDEPLAVKSWPLPGQRPAPVAAAPREPGAPPWWAGEEEASESFLKAMGVKL